MIQKRRKPHAPEGTCSFRNDHSSPAQISPENSAPNTKRQPARGTTALKQSLIASYSFDRMTAADCIRLIRFFGLEGA